MLLGNHVASYSIPPKRPSWRKLQIGIGGKIPARASSFTGGATSIWPPLAKSTILVSASAKMASCAAAFG